ncbi:MAG: hypothetical protein ACOC6F_00870 [bacterium]
MTQHRLHLYAPTGRLRPHLRRNRLLLGTPSDLGAVLGGGGAVGCRCGAGLVKVEVTG